MVEASQSQYDYTLLDILDEIAGHDRAALVNILASLIDGVNRLKEQLNRQDYSSLPDILDIIGRFKGVEQVIALVFWADILDRLSNGEIFKNLHVTLSEAQAGVFFRMFMLKTPVNNWAEVAVKNPSLSEIPEFEDGLARVVLGLNPDEHQKELLKLTPRLIEGETFSSFWLDMFGTFLLPNDISITSLPKGNLLWVALRVQHQGEWQSLSKAEQLERFIRLVDSPGKWNRILARLLRIVHRAAGKGTGKSVSDDNTVPLEAPHLRNLEDPLAGRLFEEYEWRQAYEALSAQATPAQRVALSVYLAAKENDTTVEDEGSRCGIKPQTLRDRMRELKKCDWVSEFNPYKS